ncbi:MAG TPA: hypothetical protein VEV87_04440 [Chitinophagaceae bacterium]|nr:hypothetical protein [Chitinophagaceae bacterium]
MRILLTLVFVISGFETFSQLRVSGRVFDISKSIPLPSVSVLTTSGRGTVTDSLGNYSIEVSGTDSIFFSYLNKPTTKFPVRAIPNFYSFDISLHVPVSELPVVKVQMPNYRRDSLQNRRDYEKIFNYKKPGISVATSPSGGAGVGLDLQEFISIFRFRQNRHTLAFQKRLRQEEIDKFIDHRFTKATVRKVTALTGDSLNVFMKEFRPSYGFTQLSSDYEFLEYIKLASAAFRRYGIEGRPPEEE